MTIPSSTAIYPDLIPTRKRKAGVARLVSHHPAAAVGLLLLAILTLIAVLAPVLWTKDPAAMSPVARLQPPSSSAWFGTDMLGRDVYSRVIYGSRVSLIVGFFVAFLSSVLGLFIGLVSGFIRWADTIIMRLTDGVMAIPPILFAIAIVAFAGGGLTNVIVAVTIANVPAVTRLVRAVTLSLRDQPFVDAAIASGTRTPLIILRHILPNTIAPLTVQATFICAGAMLAEATLSFIGVGTPPTTPSWGNIISEGRSLWQLDPYLIAFPALGLSLTVLAVNLLGDGLRDMLDPRFARGL